ncbi:FAD-dependent 5-carboxymethylaminomethyl-2-thiouridine(34) oxidoreductase MnmC [Massilia sp. TWP1-3-3]|uniref:FAD-dependent 5-carboxymethylaminomethyl-2-thiouridine(34) oxidoreductase MnmC n=1 Tax=Massilia sp. TWP1-3-3 TaxID=2804573 RepID=UPI003CF15385
MLPASGTAASSAMDWQGRAQFTVFDSDYGDGERFRTLLQRWRDDGARPARLHYIALHASPLPGFRRIPQMDAGVTLDLLCAPLDEALAQLDARLDAITLHAIAGTSFARALARLAAPGARLTASALTTAQAHTLGGAGFACTSGPDGTLRAVFTTRKPPSPWMRTPEPQRRAIVLGAGIAGAAACERLCARGWHVTLVERHAQAASEASGNQAGIYMPLLSQDDNVMTRLSRAAFLYALAYWDTLGGIGPGARIHGAACGVLQLARGAQHAGVQRAIAARHGYPSEYAQWLEEGPASALLGSAAPDGAWLFRQAGWAQPASVCAAMLDACGSRLVRRFGAGSVRLVHGAGQWSALDASGTLVASAPVVIVANGTGARHLAQTDALPLASVRGQVTYLAEGALPALPFVLCREAYLTPAVKGWHSLGASYDADPDPALRQASQLENLVKIGSMLDNPALGGAAPLAGRVGFRCVAPDRLPLVGALPQQDDGARIERLRQVPRQNGLYGLLGYASRGLAWAPLAAELLASQLDGEPLPLEAELTAALDPARFQVRARRRL